MVESERDLPNTARASDVCAWQILHEHALLEAPWARNAAHRETKEGI